MGSRIPTIYNLSADYWRFSITANQAASVLANKYVNRTGYQPKIIVLHIQDGNTIGSLGWWADHAKASSTVMIQKNGSILRVIPEHDAPWTNGDVNQPSDRMRKIMNTYGSDPNLYTLSIETEGRPDDTMPETQFNAIIWQCREWQDKYQIPIERIVPHREINSVSRARCPGWYYDEVIKFLREGHPIESKFPDIPIPETLFTETIFPGATPGQPFTNYYMETWVPIGHFPPFVKAVTGSDGARYGYFPPHVLRWSPTDNTVVDLGELDDLEVRKGDPM